MDDDYDDYADCEVGPLSFFIDFLLDSTLFVIDIHQNIPILLILTPFDHF